MIIGQKIEYFLIECDCGSECSITDENNSNSRYLTERIFCDKCGKHIMSHNYNTFKTTIHKKNFKKTDILNVDDTKVYYKLKKL